jgi:hypothetical protein
MRTLCLFLLCFLMVGCSRMSYQLGTALTEQQVAATADSADLSQVLGELGPPQRIAAIADGYVLGWEHWRISEKSLGVSLGPLGVDLFSIDWGNARMAGEFLMVRFDQDHQLTDYSFTRWDESAGSGAALQPSLGVVDVVDVDDLLTPMPQHRWGATWLRPLPAPLNSNSSPDSGVSALEQRGTPTGAGQRSLEE